MMSAAASLGLSLLWDTEVGLSHIDKDTFHRGTYQSKWFFSDAEYREILILCPVRLVPCSPP
jgi:hypothetical protein